MNRLHLAAFASILVYSAYIHAQSPGPEFSGGITAIGQQANDKRVDPLTTASADLFVTLERETGSWLLYLEANTSPADNGVASILRESNADAGSALDRERSGRGQISELNYTFKMDQATLTTGLIDTSGYLDRSRITNDENVQFIGAGFVNNPTIEFPDYSLGLAYQRSAGGGLPEINAVISSSHGIADNPNLSYAQLLSVNDNDKGVFAGVGLGMRSESSLFRIGAWLNSAAHNSSTMTKSDLNNYGVYGVYGLTTGAHGLNVRAGIANNEVSQASHFLSIAYRYRFEHGAFGLGMSRTFLSDKFNNPAGDDTTQYEVFYRIGISDIMHITPSVQYLQNSSFDPSGLAFDPDIAIAGLRLHYAF